MLLVVVATVVVVVVAAAELKRPFQHLSVLYLIRQIHMLDSGQALFCQ